MGPQNLRDLRFWHWVGPFDLLHPHWVPLWHILQGRLITRKPEGSRFLKSFKLLYRNIRYQNPSLALNVSLKILEHIKDLAPKFTLDSILCHFGPSQRQIKSIKKRMMAKIVRKTFCSKARKQFFRGALWLEMPKNFRWRWPL